jgi:hypothetical protein
MEKIYMALPRAVQAADQKADELYQQMYSSQEGEQSDEQPSESQSADADEQSGDTAEAQGIEVPQSVQQDQVGSNEESSENKSQGGDDSWENRYKILSGKYSAEVPTLAAEKRELRHKLQQLEKELDNLKNAPQQERLVKDEEIAEYGENLVDLIRRAAREEVASKDATIDELKAKLDAFEHHNQKTVVVDFYQRLGQLVPDWVAVNENKNFHKWLAERDELTGQERQEMLSTAEADKNPERVAAFFNSWKKQTQNMVAQASTKLETQVAPSSMSGDAPPPGKRIWTRGQIADFYAQVRRGEMSDDKALAIESEIQLASVEGRVR